MTSHLTTRAPAAGLLGRRGGRGAGWPVPVTFIRAYAIAEYVIRSRPVHPAAPAPIPLQPTGDQS